MQQGQAQQSHFTRIVEHIGIPLRQGCNDIAREPLPERWVDLIKKRWPPLPHEP
jgi:hypothetical protein